MREFLRRLVLLIGISVAIGMAMTASLKPLVLVESVEYMRDYPVIEVSGDEWKTFYSDVVEIMEHPQSHPQWHRRMDDWRLKYKSDRVKALWFEPWEGPLPSVMNELKQKPNSRAYLAYNDGGNNVYLEVTHYTYSKDNWIAFIGFSGREPPSKTLYPLRPYWFIPLVAGLLFYIFLPRARISKTADLYIRRWRLALADIISVLLFCPFFLLPFFLGGPIQAFLKWWGIALFCWPISFLGLFALSIAAWYASLRLTPGNDGIELHSWSVNELIAYDSIARVDPAILKPPRWLKACMWVMAFMGKGSSATLAAGQAAILEGSASGGWTFHVKDGRTFDFWYTDQMGGPIFINLELLKGALERARVVIGSEPVPREGLGFGISFQGKGKRMSTYVLLVFLGTPILIVALFAMMSAFLF